MMSWVIRNASKALGFIGTLKEAGFTVEMMDKVRKDPDFARAVVDFLKQHPRLTLVHGLFTSAEQQIEQMRKLNSKLGLGISDEEFAKAEKSIPAWPDEKLVAVVLVPYLADKKAEDGTVLMTSIERTFYALFTLPTKVEQSKIDHYFKNRIRFAEPNDGSLVHAEQAGLRWEIINLGCNCNMYPANVRSAGPSPSAGILAAVILHPHWYKSMDGYEVPYVFVTGYQIYIPSRGSWAGIIGLSHNSGSTSRKLTFGANVMQGSRWAVPSFFQESSSALE